MRKYIVAAFIFILALPAFSQNLPGGVSPFYDIDEGSDLIERYYASVMAKGANMINDWGLELGARAGVVAMNEHLKLGAGFYSLLSQNIKIHNGAAPNPYALRLSYGGLEAEYSIRPSERIRLSASILAGVGQTSYSSTDDNQNTHTLPGEWFTILEPALRLDYRLSKNIWVGPSLNYRNVMGVHNMNLSDRDFSRVGVSLTLTSYIY